MGINLIACMDKNRVIGRDNTLPWHLPEDMKHFKRTTTGQVVVMGRRTYESLGMKSLPNRTNIVLSEKLTPEGAIYFADLDRKTIFSRNTDVVFQFAKTSEIFIIGGMNIYEQFLPLADRIYLTIVQGEFEGDAKFPHFITEEWEVAKFRDFKADENNPYNMQFLTLDRI